MALFRASREHKPPDPHTNIKIAIFSIGAVLALLGMALNNRWFIYTAIGVLAVGLILRIVSARSASDTQDQPDEPTAQDDSTNT